MFVTSTHKQSMSGKLFMSLVFALLCHTYAFLAFVNFKASVSAFDTVLLIVFIKANNKMQNVKDSTFLKGYLTP